MNELTVTNGKLPVTYVAAKKALAECARVDECQEWANKAAALSSYARQAKDESLRRMADRIQARATRRCGELLKQVPTANGRNGRSEIDTSLPPGRIAAAAEAGLTKPQAIKAINVANVPEKTFERMVEAEDPAPTYKLAEMGRESRTDTPPLDVSAIRKFARFCGSTDAASFAASVTDPDMKKELTALIGEIDSWLDQFVTQL
jgi:hypothetical protein